jgi:hypothetical protein
LNRLSLGDRAAWPFLKMRTIMALCQPSQHLLETHIALWGSYINPSGGGGAVHARPFFGCWSSLSLSLNRPLTLGFAYFRDP